MPYSVNRRIVKNAKKEKLERVTLYLPPADIRGLTDVEKTTRVNTSEYMRLLVDAFLRYYERERPKDFPTDRHCQRTRIR